LSIDLFQGPSGFKFHDLFYKPLSRKSAHSPESSRYAAITFYRSRAF